MVTGNPVRAEVLSVSAGDEQRHNARHLAAPGAAVALDGGVLPDLPDTTSASR